MEVLTTYDSFTNEVSSEAKNRPAALDGLTERKLLCVRAQ